MIKFEVVITAWEDGLYLDRRRIESDDRIEASNLAHTAMEDILEKAIQKRADFNRQIEDDDIPF